MPLIEGPAARCTELTSRPDWRSILAAALDSDDLETFRPAIWPASLLKIPLRDRIKRHLPGAPYDIDPSCSSSSSSGCIP